MAGAAAAATTAVLYGSGYVATAIALQSFTPVGAVLGRGGIGAIALGLVLLFVDHPALRPHRLTRAAAWRLLVLGACAGPLFVLTMNVAVELSGASITSFVAGLYAVVAAVIAVPLLGERLERLTIGALVLAVLGAALLGEVELGGTQSLGVGVGMVAAVFFATFLVLSRRWSRAYDLPGPTIGLAALTLSALAAAALLPFVPPVTNGVAVHAGPVAALLWLAFGLGVAAPILIIIGMRRLEARRASAFLLLNPPVAAIGSWLLLGERFTVMQLLGAALILVAMAAASGLFSRRA